MGSDDVQALVRRTQAGDNGVRCFGHGGWGGDFTFYLPGEVVTTGDGKKVRCGNDGNFRYVR